MSKANDADQAIQEIKKFLTSAEQFFALAAANCPREDLLPLTTKRQEAENALEKFLGLEAGFQNQGEMAERIENLQEEKEMLEDQVTAFEDAMDGVQKEIMKAPKKDRAGPSKQLRR